MDNANLPADVKLSQVLEAPYGYGFNLKKADELVDLVAEGILDPYLVIEQVVENSASMAANVVTIDCLNIFIDKEDDWADISPSRSRSPGLLGGVLPTRG